MPSWTVQEVALLVLRVGINVLAQVISQSS
jgi:hypothetical protein